MKEEGANRPTYYPLITRDIRWAYKGSSTNEKISMTHLRSHVKCLINSIEKVGYLFCHSCCVVF